MCRVPLDLDESTRARLIPAIESAAAKGFPAAVELAAKAKNNPTYAMPLFKAVGCPECNTTGYKGRIGIYEAVLIDESIEEILRESPSEREIRKASEHQGILTMVEDGILKASLGITTLDELERVIEIEGDA